MVNQISENLRLIPAATNCISQRARVTTVNAFSNAYQAVCWPDDLSAAIESLLRVLISFRIVLAIPFKILLIFGLQSTAREKVGNMVRGNVWRREGNGERKWRTRCCGTLFPHGIRRFAQLFSSGHPTNGNPLRRHETKSPPFCQREKFREEGGRRGRKRERAHAREDPVEARSFRHYRSRPPLTRPLSSARTSVGRTSLSTSLRKEEIGFRLYSRNLKPPLLRLSLNAVQFSVSYSLPLH